METISKCGEGLSYTDRAYSKLEHLCYTKLRKERIYG